MIKRIYAHNFRCLINFEISLDNINLLIGPSGAGKSTLVDLLALISTLISENGSVEDLFKRRISPVGTVLPVASRNSALSWI